MLNVAVFRSVNSDFLFSVLNLFSRAAAPLKRLDRFVFADASRITRVD